jgi:hypothetical protein
MLVAESNGAHVSKALRSPDMAKMDPSAADMALAVWNGYVLVGCMLLPKNCET